MISVNSMLSGVTLYASTFILVFVLYQILSVFNIQHRWVMLSSVLFGVGTAFVANGAIGLIAGKALSAYCAIVLAPKVYNTIMGAGSAKKEEREYDE